MPGDHSHSTPGPLKGSFLNGPTLYLRGIDPIDADAMIAWYPSPFPLPSDLAAERLKDEVPGDAHRGIVRLVACRHADDEQIGSVEYAVDEGYTAWLSLHTSPWLGSAEDAVRAELLAIVLPWLHHERQMTSVWAELPLADDALIAAATGFGMRRAYRFRGGSRFHGRRSDLVCYESLHPTWVARLGMPEVAVEGEPIVAPKSPAPRRWNPVTNTIPRNAHAVGNRLYLRPIEQGDAEEIARWSVRESDHIHDLGRHLRSPISDWVWNRRNAEDDAQSWVRFSIVTLEDGVVIGSMGLADLDWITRSAESEIVLSRPDYRGAGFGTEAKHLLLEYAFEQLDLEMVKSYCWAFNVRSAAALRNQGYRAAGGLSWTGVRNAEFVNDLTFDLLADEWRAASGRI